MYPIKGGARSASCHRGLSILITEFLVFHDVISRARAAFINFFSPVISRVQFVARARVVISFCSIIQKARGEGRMREREAREREKLSLARFAPGDRRKRGCERMRRMREEVGGEGCKKSERNVDALDIYYTAVLCPTFIVRPVLYSMRPAHSFLSGRGREREREESETFVSRTLAQPVDFAAQRYCTRPSPTHSIIYAYFAIRIIYKRRACATPR